MGDAIYALGGYDGRLCVSSVEIYDPQRQTWEYGASTKLARSFPGLFTVYYGLGNSVFLTFHRK